MAEISIMNASGAPNEDSHQRILANLLLLFQREIEQTLRPEVTSSYAQFVADTMASMLGFIADWTAEQPYPQIDAGRAALMDKFGQAITAPKDRLRAFDDTAGNDGALEQTAKQTLDGGDDNTKARFIKDIGALHDALYTAQTERHQAARDTERARMDKLDIDLTPDLFDRFARSRMDLDDPAQSVTKIPGGQSKDTFLVSLKSGRDLIVRRNFPFGPTESSAPNEFSMLTQLLEHGMPVPRPIYASFDAKDLGQPALVVERVPGENALVAAKKDPELGRHVCFELARLLAKLHNITPKALGLSVADGDAQDQVRAYVGYWRDWWESNRIHASSLMEAGFAWLDAHVPDDVERVVPVHGDARPDNMMSNNGQVSALLDWEFLHAGDASEDLQYAKVFVEPFVTWDEFLDIYMKAGGAPVSEASTKFYNVFRSLRNVVCVDTSWSGFVKGKYPAFKLASQGVLFRHFLVQDLAQSLKV